MYIQCIVCILTVSLFVLFPVEDSLLLSETDDGVEYLKQISASKCV